MRNNNLKPNINIDSAFSIPGGAGKRGSKSLTGTSAGAVMEILSGWCNPKSRIGLGGGSVDCLGGAGAGGFSSRTGWRYDGDGNMGVPGWLEELEGYVWTFRWRGLMG